MIAIAAVLANPYGFSAGEQPLDTPWKSANACADCHEDEASDWEQSRHRVAHSNALYQSGLVDEPSPFCVNCHSPIAAQAQEVAANLPAYAWLNPNLRRGPQPSLANEPLADQGVTCAACHVRDGTVLGPGQGIGAPHSVTQTPMSDPVFCEGCHEFQMPEFSADQTWTLTEVPMQSTVSEWREWGGEQTCVDCHMPGGRHLFRGAHDRDFLASALSVDLEVTGTNWRFTLQSVGTGHSFPTGDLFRNLTLEIGRGDIWTVVHRMGRRFEVVLDPQTAKPHKQLIEDSTLQPGVPVIVEVPRGERWRVRYHYGSEQDEHRAQLDEHTLYAILATGSPVRTAPPR